MSIMMQNKTFPTQKIIYKYTENYNTVHKSWHNLLGSSRDHHCSSAEIFLDEHSSVQDPVV